MLILERRQGDGVVVPGARLEIEVVEIRGQVVRLGFKAPQDVDIFRTEIWTRMAFDRWEGQDQEQGDDT